MRSSAPSGWNISVLRMSGNDGWITRSGAFLLLRICGCERTPRGNVPELSATGAAFTFRFAISSKPRTAHGFGRSDPAVFSYRMACRHAGDQEPRRHTLQVLSPSKDHPDDCTLGGRRIRSQDKPWS